MLRRLLRYGDKVYDLWAMVGQIADRRRSPPHETGDVFRCILVMALLRLGSVHALAKHGKSRFWRRWLRSKVAPGHTIRRAAAKTECDTIRAAIQHLYARRKRNKSLPPAWHGMSAVVFDGHEVVASAKTRCDQCCRRTLHTRHGDTTEYYHRVAAAMLVTGKAHLMMDVEMQRPGETEVAAAIRLLDRICLAYPRAFDLVLADGLYAQAPFFKRVRSHGLHVLAVLKNEQRDLVKDIRGLCSVEPSATTTEKRKVSEWWDFDGLTSWDTMDAPVRVVRSLETVSVRRHMTKEIETTTTDWLWVTTLPRDMASTKAVVELGHGRWAIENQGFNELVNEWHADHVYTHHATAITAFWLMTMFAYNLFHAFIELNVKAALRAKFGMRDIARMLLADFLLFLPELHGLSP
jgi:hypothetical protein